MGYLQYTWGSVLGHRVHSLFEGTSVQVYSPKTTDCRVKQITVCDLWATDSTYGVASSALTFFTSVTAGVKQSTKVFEPLV